MTAGSLLRKRVRLGDVDVMIAELQAKSEELSSSAGEMAGKLAD